MAALLRGRSRRLLRIASPGSRAPWSELPADLLALVLSRLPSQTDRVRLRAVCRAWRSAARLRPLSPPLPWLFVRGDTFLTLSEGAPHRMPLDLNEIHLRVPAGSMFFLVRRDGRCSLMNPSSGEMTPLQPQVNSNRLKIDLSCRSYNWISKVVVSDRIVAVTVPYSGMVTIFPRTATTSSGAGLCWVPPAASTDVVDTDIALFQGELYVVLTKKHHISGSESELPELHRLEIDEQQNRVRSVQCIRGRPRNGVDDPGLREHESWRSVSNLVECGNRLLMVERERSDPGLREHESWRSVSNLVECGNRLLMVERYTVVEKFVVWDDVSRGSGSIAIRTQIKVWEGVDLTGSHGHWSKADTLMGHALFVSRGCSESLPAAQCGARQDCIYFVTTEHPRLRSRRKMELHDDVLRCVVYNVRDRRMEPLETMAATASPWEQPTWFFPADA
uniref:Uncharacterized protein n=1 Tax=Aegilops tauschii TaxID=37682 RepID=R7W900_AEGTA